MEGDINIDSSKIGDKSKGVDEEVLNKKVRRTFPWRAFLLGLSRLVVSVACCVHGGSQFVVRRDGSTTAKRLIRRKYNYLKFTSHKSNMVPVLSLSLNADRIFAVVSAASSIGLLVAVVLTYRRWRMAENIGSRNEKNQRNRSFSVILAALLTVIELQLVIVDMIHVWAESLNYSHMLLMDVGLQEAMSFFMTSVILNGLQTYLWFGGLEFQKTFLEK